MNQEEKNKFKKQYQDLTDGQLSEMLSEGIEAYVEGVYELLQAEAERRGLELDSPAPLEAKNEEPESLAPSQQQLDVNTYVQLMIVNCEADRALIESIFNPTDIPYYFQNLNIRPEKSLPVGLMVDNIRVEDALELLRSFKPSESIILW
jgi:hypothetical protein